MGHALGLQQLKRGFGAESASESDDFTAEVQRGQQRVHQPTRPRPIGGAPEDGVGELYLFSTLHILKAEPVLTANKSGQIANQRPMRNQSAFWRARRAAGVDQNRAIVRFCSNLKPIFYYIFNSY